MWKKRLRTSVSVAVLCCVLPYSAVAAQPTKLDPRIALLPRVSVPLGWSAAPAESSHQPVSRYMKKDSESIVAQPRVKRSPLDVIWSERAATPAFSTPVSPQVAQNAPQSPNVALAKQQDSPSANKIIPLPPAGYAPLPWLVVKPNTVIVAASAPVQKLRPSPLEVIAAVEAEEQAEESQKTQVMAKTEAIANTNSPIDLVASDIKPYTASGDRTVWRDEKEEQYAVVKPEQSMVLVPPRSAVTVALENVLTKTTLAKLETAVDRRLEPIAGKPFNVQAALADIAPAAGEPTVLVPPTAPPPAPPPEPQQQTQTIAPPPKLDTPDEVPATEETSTELPKQELPDAAKVRGVGEELTLSPETKDILDRLPPEPKTSSKVNTPVAVERTRKQADTDVKKHDAYGMKIAVKRPQMDVFRTLESAYNSLIAGDQQYALTLYKQVLDEDPENTLALFGLATTYHRAGQTQLARPIYGKLLDIDPQNVEGLNNFLVLLADESPKEALVELERLQRSHSGFSPVPAQMSLIYEKQGDFAKAAEKMTQALALSPENLKYQYNMAIIFDKMGDWDESAKWYQRLITAQDRGEKIPGNAQEIQQRLTFIRSNTSSQR
jgi:lipopolysaccharide assembly protein B